MSLDSASSQSWRSVFSSKVPHEFHIYFPVSGVTLTSGFVFIELDQTDGGASTLNKRTPTISLLLITVCLTTLWIMWMCVCLDVYLKQWFSVFLLAALWRTKKSPGLMVQLWFSLKKKHQYSNNTFRFSLNNFLVQIKNNLDFCWNSSTQSTIN